MIPQASEPPGGRPRALRGRPSATLPSVDCRPRVWAGRATTRRRATPSNPSNPNCRIRLTPSTRRLRSRLRLSSTKPSASPWRTRANRSTRKTMPSLRRPAAEPEQVRSRYPAAILDALIPGLGPSGRRPPGSRPPVRLAAAGHGRRRPLGPGHDIRSAGSPRRSSSDEVIWGLLAAQALLLASRLIAVGSSLFDPALPRPGRRDLLRDRAPPGLRHRAAGLRGIRDRDRPRGRRPDLRRARRGGGAVELAGPDPSFLASAPPSASAVRIGQPRRANASRASSSASTPVSAGTPT